MSSEIQYMPMPRSQESQTAELLHGMAKDVANQKRLERSANKAKQSKFSNAVDNAKGKATVKAVARKNVRKNSFAPLTKLVNEHNAYIDLNDLNDPKIDVNDYYDKNSPSYLEKNDTMGIGEERDYLQNQMFRMQGDKRYVPDYEEMKKMSDDQYMKFIDDIGMVEGNGSDENVSDFDKMSDDQFYDDMNRRMAQ